MARLEDLLRGLRAEDLPEDLREPLAPLLTALDAALTSVWNAVVGGNLTLADNVGVEKIDCQLTHGVAQTVLLKKLKRAGCVVGYSAGEDSGGTGHAFAMPPMIQPTSTPGVAQITAYFRNNTAKRVACTLYVAPDGTTSSKSKSSNALGAAGTNTKVTADAEGRVTALVAAVLASADFVNQGTATTLLHGNAAGNPSFSAVDLVNDITSTLAEGHGGTNQTTYAQGDVLYASAASTLAKLAKGTSGQLLQIGATIPAWTGDTSWTAPTLLGTWANDGGNDQVAGYMKDASGFVHLRGSIKSGTLGTAAFNLPSGYRPNGKDVFFAINAGAAFGRVKIDGSTSPGDVVPDVGATTGNSLDGITFDTR